jgi:hypothetical protein
VTRPRLRCVHCSIWLRGTKGPDRNGNANPEAVLYRVSKSRTAPIAPRMTPRDTVTPEYARLRTAITERLNAHDLLGVLPHGAPETEYDPEMEDFAALITAGGAITPEVVAAVWHKWFGDSFGETTGEPELPTPAMESLAADLQALGK